MSNAPLITWESLKALLPHDLSSLAKSTGAVERWRKITSGEQLLWMCLVYAQAFMSMRVTAGLSVAFGGVTEGAVKHRLMRAGPFLAAILGHVLNASLAKAWECGLTRAVRLADSTALSIPGSTGTDWRIHTSFIPGKAIAAVDVTDSSGAEALRRAEPGCCDIVIGDQGYCRARDLHHARDVGSHSLVRAYLKNIKLLMEDGGRLDINEALNRADAGDTTTTVWVPLVGSKPLQARLIIRALPPDKAEEARRRLRRKASRKQSNVTAQALRLTGYFVVLTTIPAEELSDEEVLILYKLRWQVELLFKRWKSLLNLDKLEASEPSLVRTFCLSKLIEAAILEREGLEALEDYASSCPDDDHERPSCTMWRITVVYHAAFLVAVLTAFPMSRVMLTRAIEAMREGKRRRKNASASLAALLRRVGHYAPEKEAA